MTTRTRALTARVCRGILLGLRTVRYLGTMRRAFPWPLRVLLIVGAIQVPFSPLDEVCAVIAATWLLVSYRPALRVAYRAAQLETARYAETDFDDWAFGRQA